MPKAPRFRDRDIMPLTRNASQYTLPSIFDTSSTQNKNKGIGFGYG